MMTIDCAPEAVDAIAHRLDEAERAGSVVYGLHRQSTALVTCMVPSALRSDHIHFVDGAAGGQGLLDFRLRHVDCTILRGENQIRRLSQDLRLFPA